MRFIVYDVVKFSSSFAGQFRQHKDSRGGRADRKVHRMIAEFGTWRALTAWALLLALLHPVSGVAQGEGVASDKRQLPAVRIETPPVLDV